MAKAQDCEFVVSVFKLQSHYYFLFFLTNTVGKGMKPLFLQLSVK